jgi:uncharacterized protein YkwD
MNLRPLLSLLCLAIGCGLLRADPTAQQQYYLELLNRARLDPAAELNRIVNLSSASTWGIPASNDPSTAGSLALFGTSAAALTSQWAGLTAAPALAWSDSLAASALGYSQLMVSLDSQSHTLDGLSLDDRILNSGYSTAALDLGENLYAGAGSTAHAHAAFLIDWGLDGGSGTGIQPGATHRALALDPAMKEFGIGIVDSIPLANMSAVGPYVVTEHFANTVRLVGGNYIMDSILTGVVFDDQILADNFYTPGEGLSGYIINVYDHNLNSLLYSGTTNAAGGYNISLLGSDAGDVLRVELAGSGMAGEVFTVQSRVIDYATSGGGTTPVILYDNAYASFALIPEPSSALLALLGGVGLMRRSRRRE